MTLTLPKLLASKTCPRCKDAGQLAPGYDSGGSSVFQVMCENCGGVVSKERYEDWGEFVRPYEK